MSEDELLDEYQTDDILQAAALFWEDERFAQNIEQDLPELWEKDCAELEMNNFILRYDKFTLGFGPKDYENDPDTIIFYNVQEHADEDSAIEYIKQMKEE